MRGEARLSAPGPRRSASRSHPEAQPKDLVPQSCSAASPEHEILRSAQDDALPSAERRAPRARRTGAALLEALVALTVLSTAGVAVVALVTEGADAVRRAQEADLRTREASAFLDAVALWPREDLDRRLGDRAQGPWRLRVERPSPTLYVVVLADSAGARAPLLATALYRPEPSRHEQR